MQKMELTVKIILTMKVTENKDSRKEFTFLSLYYSKMLLELEGGRSAPIPRKGLYLKMGEIQNFCTLFLGQCHLHPFSYFPSKSGETIALRCT